MNDKDLKAAILGWLDAQEAMIGKFREELEGKPRATPAQAIDYDTEKIKWQDKPDTGNGPWQLADIKENAVNEDFVKFRLAVRAGLGARLSTKTHTVWQMKDGESLGRKLFKDCKRKN